MQIEEENENASAALAAVVVDVSTASIMGNAAMRLVERRDVAFAGKIKDFGTKANDGAEKNARQIQKREFIGPISTVVGLTKV